MSNRKLVLDLHPIYNQGDLIDESLERIIEEAEEKKAKEVEIICGKGSGQLKKHVLRFLNHQDIRQRYYSIDKDPLNHGRVFVQFRWK